MQHKMNILIIIRWMPTNFLIIIFEGTMPRLKFKK